MEFKNIQGLEQIKVIQADKLFAVYDKILKKIFINSPRVRFAYPAPLFLKATLYTYLLEKGMMHNRQEDGLKGQHIIAQGKRRRSGALGWEVDREIVRAITFKK